jgi:hypothetical protein
MANELLKEEKNKHTRQEFRTRDTRRQSMILGQNFHSILRQSLSGFLAFFFSRLYAAPFALLFFSPSYLEDNFE